MSTMFIAGWHQFIRLVQSCKEAFLMHWVIEFVICHCGLKLMVLGMLGKNGIMQFLFSAKWSCKEGFHDKGLGINSELRATTGRGALFIKHVPLAAEPLGHPYIARPFPRSRIFSRNKCDRSVGGRSPVSTASWTREVSWRLTGCFRGKGFWVLTLFLQANPGRQG